jgi:hypothetical protein
LPLELQPFGRSDDDFGELFLWVRGFLLYSFSDRLCLLGGQSVLADSLLGVADRLADHLDRSGVFRLEATFVLRTVRALSSGQSAPSLADSPRQLGRQSDLYANFC